MDQCNNSICTPNNLLLLLFLDYYFYCCSILLTFFIYIQLMETPLHEAARNGSNEVAGILLQYQSHPNAINQVCLVCDIYLYSFLAG